MRGIFQRGNRWIVQIRRKGIPDYSRTFGFYDDDRVT